jgi:3-oxoacyl-[acyl-carrier-protein] synthase III
MIQQARLSAIGTYVPEKAMTNQYFESIIDTSDEWIISRTGIKCRYHTAADEYTSHLCLHAVHDLQERYGADISNVDMVIVSTVSPDQPMPSMACQVQHHLGLKGAGAVDVYAACAGFSYGLVLAKGLIAAGTHKKVLVIGGENLSRLTDFTDRTSCLLFGDGAGAVLIEAAEQGNVRQCITGSHGDGGQDLYISGFSPTVNGQEIQMSGKIVQNGRRVFKWAVTTMAEQMKVLAAKNGLTLDDIDWFVPHSANLRIIEAICHETGFPLEKTLESIVHYGNTSSASIPLALCQGLNDGKLKSGDKVMILGFGGGLAFAGTVVEWP